jgi:hypothetical protein
MNMKQKTNMNMTANTTAKGKEKEEVKEIAMEQAKLTGNATPRA